MLGIGRLSFFIFFLLVLMLIPHYRLMFMPDHRIERIVLLFKPDSCHTLTVCGPSCDSNKKTPHLCTVKIRVGAYVHGHRCGFVYASHIIKKRLLFAFQFILIVSLSMLHMTLFSPTLKFKYRNLLQPCCHHRSHLQLTAISKVHLPGS